METMYGKILMLNVKIVFFFTLELNSFCAIRAREAIILSGLV